MAGKALCKSCLDFPRHGPAPSPAAATRCPLASPRRSFRIAAKRGCCRGAPTPQTQTALTALTVIQIDQAAALRSALHLNVEVSGDAHHLANAASLKNDGRISSRPLRIFHFDPPREFGVGISHEAQRHVDEFLGALEHTSHM